MWAPGASSCSTPVWPDPSPACSSSRSCCSLIGRWTASANAICCCGSNTGGERHLVLSLHHHPVRIGGGEMESVAVRSADRLWQRLDAEARVRTVLWGHIHQQLEQQRESVRLLASPSTCVQFAAGSSDFATDQQAPGYRWLRLHDDGRMETGVSRLAPGSFPPEAGASGY